MLTMRLKNKTRNILQIKNQEKSRELRLIRPQTQHKIPEHMYTKFLTTHQHSLSTNRQPCKGVKYETKRKTQKRTTKIMMGTLDQGRCQTEGRIKGKIRKENEKMWEVILMERLGC
jgi:hypothetical protein